MIQLPGDPGVDQRIDSSVHAIQPADTNLIIDLTANNTDDNNTAFSVQAALVPINQYVQRVRGSRLPDITVVFPTTEFTSLFDGTKLHILQLDRFDWDVIGHEYGHYAMSRFGIENNPGGEHSLGENLGERLGKDEGTRLAWGEGWPSYFAVSLQQVLDVTAQNIPNAGDTLYQDTEDTMIAYDLESTDGAPDSGEDAEISVQRSLWDVYDATNDAGDEGVAYGDSRIMDTLIAASTKTVSEAFQALAAGQTVSQTAQLGCIFSEHKDLARADGPSRSERCPNSIANLPMGCQWWWSILPK